MTGTSVAAQRQLIHSLLPNWTRSLIHLPPLMSQMSHYRTPFLIQCLTREAPRQLLTMIRSQILSPHSRLPQLLTMILSQIHFLHSRLQQLKIHSQTHFLHSRLQLLKIRFRIHSQTHSHLHSKLRQMMIHSRNKLRMKTPLLLIPPKKRPVSTLMRICSGIVVNRTPLVGILLKRLLVTIIRQRWNRRCLL